MVRNFDEIKKVADIKKAVRETAFSDLMTAFSDLYGADNVSIVGNAELAICIGTKTLTDGTVGEVCFTIKPVAKDFDFRTTDSGRVFKPYERLSEADSYEFEKTEKEREAEEKAKAKEEKKKRDKEAREKAKAEKAKK